MTARIEFSVSLVAGKQRHGLDRRHARMHTPDETLRAGRAIAAACREAMAEAGIRTMPFGPHEPVILNVDACRPLPESRPRRVRSEPDTYRPDADNEAKLAMDALNGLVRADDAQVVDLRARKHPRARGQSARGDETEEM